MKRLITGAALALAFGGGAQAAVQDLVPPLRKACRPSSTVRVDNPGDYGLISAKAVRAALFAQFPLSPDVMMEGPEVMAKRAMKPEPPATEPPLGDDDRQLSRYRRIVETWSETSARPLVAPTLEDGGIRFEPTGDGQDIEARLVQLFKGDDNLRILCRDPTPEPPAPAPVDDGDVGSGRPTFALVKAAPDLAEADITKKTFAEFSYSNDRQTRVQSWAVKLAAGLQWAQQSRGGDGGYLKWTPRLYVAFDRQGEDDPASDGYVNNLDLGAQVSGRFGFGNSGTYYYTASGAYRTDDDLESEAYAVELTLSPPLPFRRFHRGYGRISNGPLEIDFKWDANLAADWVQVDDVGRRKALADQAEYLRLGYDGGFDLLFGPSSEEWRFLFSADYGLRDGLTDDGGDAQMFNAGLVFQASDETNWSFGLSYERGENLQSFEKSEIWKLVFGVRL